VDKHEKNNEQKVFIQFCSKENLHSLLQNFFFIVSNTLQ